MNWKFKVNYRIKTGAVRNFVFEAEGEDYDAMMNNLEEKVDLPDDDPKDIVSLEIKGRKLS